MATTIDDRVRTRHVAKTTPYAWPWDGVLDAARTAVLAVEAPGDPGTLDADSVRNARVVVASMQRAGGVAIRVVTRRASSARPADGSASVFASAGPGAVPTDLTVTARGVDGFYGSPLESVLRENMIERLLLVGAWLETSVHSTMRTANDMGFECLLVVDACAAGDADLIANSVSMIEMSGGIFGAVGMTAHVVETYAPEEGERA